MFVKSVYDNQKELIEGILFLHCKTPIELDPTFSKGVFYKDLKEPKFKFDIFPVRNDVIKSNAENLPIKSNTINTMMFDPPFLATKGKSLEDKNSNSNKIVNRFSCYPTEKELFNFYNKSLNEFYRILKKDGILIFKCQDKVSGGKQYISHNIIINKAEEIGFYTKDIFILLAKNRLVPQWQTRNQQHARKYHSYFIVFEKSNKTSKLNI
jgi:tRNA G10  N-methylase Trm11